MEPTPEEYKMLALRTYHGLKHSGVCSAHCTDGYYDCTVCYPDYRALCEEHVKVNSELAERSRKQKSNIRWLLDRFFPGARK